MLNSINDTILVTYATWTGSTRGVAEAIGKTLTDQGTHVEVLPMQVVKDISPYRAVIAGSAIQSKQWLPEAMQFIRLNQKVLNQKPFTAFLVCMTLAMNKGDFREQVSNWLDPVRSLVKPMSVGLFAGALDISKVPGISKKLSFRLSVKLGVWSEGDHRDWNAIHDWASRLPAVLHL